MKIRVLGCHGSELSGHGTCGFLINQSVLLDAGTICSSLSLSEQKKIRVVLISHTHLDHIKSLPFLSENLIDDKQPHQIVLVGLPEILSILHRHLFNNQLWPDFTKIPSSSQPFFKMKPVLEGESLMIENLEIKLFRVNHTVPSTGFLIREKESSLVYSGDTHQTEAIWKAAAADSCLKAVMIECSFPNRLKDLAFRTKHLVPDLLPREFSKIGQPQVSRYIYHIKPRYLKEVRDDLKLLNLPDTIFLEDGMVFDL
ncbi:MAG: MBL fold metallo-hydrolase [Nitrospiria bacterium]